MTEADEGHDPMHMAMIYLAGTLAQLRAHPCTWPFNARDDFLKFEELTVPLMRHDPRARARLWAEAKAMIGEAPTWRAIEALSAALHERATLDGVEAIEIMKSAHDDDKSIVLGARLPSARRT
jgi:hypothetical protein